MSDARPHVVHAGAQHLDAVTKLADAFREGYRAGPAPDAVRSFLDAGMRKGAVVLVATLEEEAAGFVYIAPTASLLRLDHLWTLTALYVRPEARRRGVAVALLDEAGRRAREAGADALQLSADWDNAAARSLFERLGYERNLLYTTYEQKL